MQDLEILKPARFCVGIDIFDNETQEDIFNEGSNYSSAQGIIGVLELVIKKLEKY